jgi:hypothetical protein
VRLEAPITQVQHGACKNASYFEMASKQQALAFPNNTSNHFQFPNSTLKLAI